MRTIKPWFFLAVCLLIGALFALPAIASGLVPCGGPQQEDCTVCHLFKMTKEILYYSLSLTFLISSLIFILCGLNLMANRGNVRVVAKVRQVMGVTAVGLIIVFSGWVAVNTYFVSAGAAEWDGYSLNRDWWKINAKCEKNDSDLIFCGDGIVQPENNEDCDPKETIDDCQKRTGNTVDECDQLISNCDTEQCVAVP